MQKADLLGELRIDRESRDKIGGRKFGVSFKVLAFAFFVLAIVCIFGIWRWFLSPPPSVRVAPAVAAASGQVDPGAVLQATGYITARRQATVSAQITGTLTALLIEEGERVRKGQVVARLDEKQYKAALDRARAQASASHAVVEQFSLQLMQSVRDAERVRKLATRGLVSKQDAETADTQAKVLRAQLGAQKLQATAADASVAESQVNFDYCVVRAPFDGVITTKDAQVGEIVSPFSAGGGFTRSGIGTIVDMNSLEVDIDVNEAYISRVQPDMRAEAVLNAYPNWRIPAHIIAVVPAADRGKATVKVRVALEQNDPRILPDMGVRVSFLEEHQAPMSKQSRGVLVPAESIVNRDGHDVVFVVIDNHVVQRVVQPTNFGQLKLLSNAVAPGENVVIDPSSALRDGEKIIMVSANQ